jgi:hypothetical protein
MIGDLYIFSVVIFNVAIHFSLKKKSFPAHKQEQRYAQLQVQNVL